MSNSVRLSDSKSPAKQLRVRDLPAGAIFLYKYPKTPEVWYMRTSDGVINLQTGSVFELQKSSPEDYPRRVVQLGEAIEIRRDE